MVQIYKKKRLIFLYLTVQSDKPVVLTGSMRPATAISADGAKNLYDAIIVASDSSSKGKGVMLCFNESIYDAKNVVKTSTTNVNAFTSPNTGPIGQLYDGRVFYNARILNKHSGSIAFDISKIDSLPRVEIVYAYAGASDAAINAFINNNAAGIIIAGTGNGSFDKAIVESVKSAVKKHHCSTIIKSSFREGSYPICRNI
jgi:L-asparaginase